MEVKKQNLSIGGNERIPGQYGELVRYNELPNCRNCSATNCKLSKPTKDCFDSKKGEKLVLK